MKNNYYHSINIGSLSLKGNLFLAPLAGYTDKSFRSICTEAGANLTYTEMVSAEGLYRDQEKTESLLERAPNEVNFAIQIFTNKVDTLPTVAKRLKDYKPSLIDINCGCPVPKVVKTGSGSALMKDPALIYSIIKTLKDNTDTPITLKIRLGWDSSSVNFIEVAQAAEAAGAAAIGLHTRTRTQFYTGKADWSKFSLLKAAVNIPVLGSGDLFTPEDAKAMLSTGIDGLLFARGAIGNPFIFKQTQDYLTKGSYSVVSIPLRANTLLSHLRLTAANTSENSACKILRKHVSFYLKGISNSAPIKQQLIKATTIKEYEVALAPLL